MPRRKSVRHESDGADELLFRALRQLADEALEEEIPERLLRLVRTAERRQEATSEQDATSEQEAMSERPEGSSEPPSGPDRRD